MIAWFQGDHSNHRPPLDRLAAFNEHLAGLAGRYVKEPSTRDTQVALVHGWQVAVERLQTELQLC
jgi:hypothetical protein